MHANVTEVVGYSDRDLIRAFLTGEDQLSASLSVICNGSRCIKELRLCFYGSIVFHSYVPNIIFRMQFY
jgi:hypothetical protein